MSQEGFLRNYATYQIFQFSVGQYQAAESEKKQEM